MQTYLVRIDLTISGYEKQSNYCIKADSREEAGRLALLGECHGEVDFSEFPDKNACMDCDEMYYKVGSVKEISYEEYMQYKNITAGVFY